MSTPRTTLMDVAVAAGVSRTTASFVMTGRTDMRIAEQTRSRVLQVARELSYRPNLLSRSLRTNLTQTVGLISDAIATQGFAGESIRGALAAALDHQHVLILGETEGDAEVEKQLVNSLLDRGVGGFVYASMYTRQVSVSKVLRSHPLVLMNCLARAKGVPSVIPDEREAGRTAARHLLEAGHTDGIYLVGETPPDVIAAHERRIGIEAALAAAGVEPAGTVDTLWWPRASRNAVAKLISSGAEPKALICLNDRVALGAYQALSQAGLIVPEDVSVLSFDDSDLADWLDPGLTSIALPHLELGRRAVDLLLSPETTPQVHRIPMTLMERGSVAAPGRRKSTRRTRHTIR
ncbi:LacI family transcriptional regulator [Nakamurella sp. UYEF19]|uniref:LacI family DNA-binding transcriptional regulator n=1 Tax=Nakamurella sp. UYEF19 TaxID=1756392 RepID=UPI00339726E1